MAISRKVGDPTLSPARFRPVPTQSKTKQWLLLGFKFFAFVALAALLWWLADHEAVRAWKREASPFPFFAAMALLTAVGIPMTPFLLLAGATFGTVVGLMGSGAALAVNLLLCFWVARSGLRPRLEKLLRRTKYTLPNLEGKRWGAVRFAVLVKLTPGVPMFKHYIIALAGVPFMVYFLVSFAITGVYSAAIVVLGESLFDHDITKLVAADTALLALLVAGAMWLRNQGKRAGRKARRGTVSR